VSGVGLFDWLTGTRRPDDNLPVVPPQQVYAALLAVNRPTAPFVVLDGRPDGVDLVAEWKIVDATWYEVFAKAGLSKTFRILMRLDPAQGEVRAVDQEWSVEWRAGVPSLSLAASAFRGQSTSFEFGTAYAFTEQGTYGEVYNYRFTSSELKGPLQDAALACGWTWRGVAFGKL